MEINASVPVDIKPAAMLLDFLVCPITKSPLAWDKKNNRLISHQAKIFYPVVGGVPQLLPELANKLAD